MHETSATPESPPPLAPDPPDPIEQRLTEQSRALVLLAKIEPAPAEDLRLAFQRITEITAQTLSVQRASVWLYNEDRSAIHCVDLFERDPGRHSEGGVLEKDLFPAYFAALEAGRTIAAHDVTADDRVSEFLDAYLIPLGIGAMLDASVRKGGRLSGVLCCEHVGPKRPFTWDEQNFVGAVGDLVALAMESSERRSTADLLHARLRPAATAVAARCAALAARPEAPALSEELAQLQEASTQLMAVIDELPQ